MPRNMSFSKTVDQVRSRTKTVTRRQGWRFLKRGDILWAVEKGMGLKKGEKVKRICQIRVLSVLRQPVYYIFSDPSDIRREGFPGMLPSEFVRMYCDMNRCAPEDWCTRIEFEYV